MKTIIVIVIALGFSFFINQRSPKVDHNTLQDQTERFIKHKTSFARHYSAKQVIYVETENAVDSVIPMLVCLLEKMIVPLASVTIVMWVFLSFGFFKSFKEGR